MTWMPIGFWYAGLKCVVYYYCQLCKDEDPKGSDCHSHSHYLWGPHPYTVDSSTVVDYLTRTAMAADLRKTKCVAVNVHR